MDSDSELVQKTKKGDRQAFSELVHRHQRALLRVTLRFTRELALAEDVVQESFLKAFSKIHLFEGRSSFRSWLFRIAVNTAKNRFRGKAKEVLSLDKLKMGVPAEVEGEMIRNDLRERLRFEVEKLPEKQRLALSLRVYDDFSFKEIAEIMECPYDTAKANYRHALLRLRDRLQGEEDLQAWNDNEPLFSIEFCGAVSEVDS